MTHYETKRIGKLIIKKYKENHFGIKRLVLEDNNGFRSKLLSHSSYERQLEFVNEVSDLVNDQDVPLESALIMVSL